MYSKIEIQYLSQSQILLLKKMIERKKDNEKKKQVIKQIKQSGNSIIDSYNNTKGRVINFEKRSQNKILPDFITRNVVAIVMKGYNDGISATEAIYAALAYITNSLWYKGLSIKLQYEINFELIKQIVKDSVKAERK